jgi:hypothetical protein
LPSKSANERANLLCYKGLHFIARFLALDLRFPCAWFARNGFQSPTRSANKPCLVGTVFGRANSRRQAANISRTSWLVLTLVRAANDVTYSSFMGCRLSLHWFHALQDFVCCATNATKPVDLLHSPREDLVIDI